MDSQGTADDISEFLPTDQNNRKPPAEGGSQA